MQPCNVTQKSTQKGDKYSPASHCSISGRLLGMEGQLTCKAILRISSIKKLLQNHIWYFNFSYNYPKLIPEKPFPPRKPVGGDQFYIRGLLLN